MWELQGRMPGTIEEVVARALALRDDQVHVRRVVPMRDVRSLLCVLDGWSVRLIGEVDVVGRWWRIAELHAEDSE